MRFMLALLVMVVVTLTGRAATKPNVIIIVADDLGYADVGFHGCKDIPTPHLDALAKRGIVCTNGYVSHPFCSPTRAGLLTGRYQQRFGHENNPTWLPQNEQMGLPLDQKTIADRVKVVGYTTGAVGKWHLGAHPVFHPNRRGFDSYFGLLGGGHQYFDHNQFKTNPMRAKAEYLIPLVRNETPVEENEYLTDALGREAVGFIETNREKPFLLYLAFNAPHTPLQAPPRYLERVKDIEDQKLRTYGAMICGMDDAIGRVLTKLDEMKLAENTLIFFFSDNGGPVGVTNCRNTPFRGAKGQVYEGGVRVPFIITWPKQLKPGTFHSPVIALDVLPTTMAAIEAPVNADAKLDGQNLLPFLRGANTQLLDERPLFWRMGGGASFAVRQGDWKLIRNGKNEPELYDLKRDIGEANNRAKMEPERVVKLQQSLDQWNAEMIAPKWQNPQPPKKN